MIYSDDQNLPNYIKIIKSMNQEMIEIQNLVILIADGNASISSFIELVEKHDIISNDNKFHDFLVLLNNMSSSRIKAQEKDNINNIILSFKSHIQEKYQKNEIFLVFQFNIPIILLLYENQIIDFDTIFEYRRYEIYRFFLPEFIEKSGIEKIPAYIRDDIDPYKDNLEEFRKNRKEYHSDNEIARIIRKDDIDSFKEYILLNNLPLNYKIPDSFYEINSDLGKMTNSLIEYSATFGSIQIFEYLLNQLTELPQHILLAAVLGGSFDIIHILEQKGYKPNTFVTFRSILAHQNKLFDYFISNHSIQIRDDFIGDSLRSTNYYVFNELLIKKPEYLTKIEYINYLFSDACSYDTRVLFNALYDLPDIDVNVEKEIFFF